MANLNLHGGYCNHHNRLQANEKDKVMIRGSQFMQNSFNDLQDLISRF